MTSLCFYTTLGSNHQNNPIKRDAYNRPIDGNNNNKYSEKIKYILCLISLYLDYGLSYFLGNVSSKCIAVFYYNIIIQFYVAHNQSVMQGNLF